MTDFIDPDFHHIMPPQFAKDTTINIPSICPKAEDQEETRSDIQKLPPRPRRYQRRAARPIRHYDSHRQWSGHPARCCRRMLENILGMPPLSRQKRARSLRYAGATTLAIYYPSTPRTKLATPAITSTQSVSVFENFGPVGNWREYRPKIDTRIDPTGTLPDGTPIKDITDFKAWLVANIDHFSQCLSEKLMTYARQDACRTILS